MQASALSGGLVTRLPAATIALHPIIIFSTVWLGVLFLYSLQLSYILRYSTATAFLLVAKLWIPFALAIAVFTIFRTLFLRLYPGLKTVDLLNISTFRRRLHLCFSFWILVTIVETIASGGVPILWALRGSAKTYADFGIPSVHGLINSLQVSLSICYFLLYLLTRRRSYLRAPFFFLLWAIVIINRNMMLVTLIEFAALYVRLRPIRFKTMAQITAGALIFVLAFGIIGDIRQGSNALIRDLAQPTADYPDWLPSGVLWAYIYITTPINNLIYNVEVGHPLNSPLFPNTAYSLFPSIIRKEIYGNALDEAETGSLVASAFNVSTAYVGPFQDYGMTGIGLFSIGIATSTLLFWFKNDLRGAAMFAVVTQCLVLTIFFDHYFYLPVITQLGWLWLLFNTRRIRVPFPSSWMRDALTAC